MSMSQAARQKVYSAGYECGVSEGFLNGVVLGCLSTLLFVAVAAIAFVLPGCGPVDDCVIDEAAKRFPEVKNG